MKHKADNNNLTPPPKKKWNNWLDSAKKKKRKHQLNPGKDKPITNAQMIARGDIGYFERNAYILPGVQLLLEMVNRVAL